MFRLTTTILALRSLTLHIILVNLLLTLNRYICPVGLEMVMQ